MASEATLRAQRQLRTVPPLHKLTAATHRGTGCCLLPRPHPGKERSIDRERESERGADMAAPYLYLPYIGVAIMAVLVFDADATWLQALVRSIAFGIAAYFVWLHHRLSHAIRATNSRKLRRDIEKRLTFATYFEDIACDYDPVATQALERFDPVKHATHCVFARKSRYAIVTVESASEIRIDSWLGAI